MTREKIENNVIGSTNLTEPAKENPFQKDLRTMLNCIYHSSAATRDVLMAKTTREADTISIKFNELNQSKILRGYRLPFNTQDNDNSDTQLRTVLANTIQNYIEHSTEKSNLTPAELAKILDLHSFTLDSDSIIVLKDFAPNFKVLVSIPDGEKIEHFFLQKIQDNKWIIKTDDSFQIEALLINLRKSEASYSIFSKNTFEEQLLRQLTNKKFTETCDVKIVFNNEALYRVLLTIHEQGNLDPAQLVNIIAYAEHYPLLFSVLNGGNIPKEDFMQLPGINHTSKPLVFSATTQRALLEQIINSKASEQDKQKTGEVFIRSLLEENAALEGINAFIHRETILNYFDEQAILTVALKILAEKKTFSVDGQKILRDLSILKPPAQFKFSLLDKDFDTSLRAKVYPILFHIYEKNLDEKLRNLLGKLLIPHANSYNKLLVLFESSWKAENDPGFAKWLKNFVNDPSIEPFPDKVKQKSAEINKYLSASVVCQRMPAIDNLQQQSAQLKDLAQQQLQTLAIDELPELKNTIFKRRCKIIEDSLNSLHQNLGDEAQISLEEQNKIAQFSIKISLLKTKESTKVLIDDLLALAPLGKHFLPFINHEPAPALPGLQTAKLLHAKIADIHQKAQNTKAINSEIAKVSKALGNINIMLPEAVANVSAGDNEKALNDERAKFENSINQQQQAYEAIKTKYGAEYDFESDDQRMTAQFANKRTILQSQYEPKILAIKTQYLNGFTVSFEECQTNEDVDALKKNYLKLLDGNFNLAELQTKVRDLKAEIEKQSNEKVINILNVAQAAQLALRKIQNKDNIYCTSIADLLAAMETKANETWPQSPTANQTDETLAINMPAVLLPSSASNEEVARDFLRYLKKQTQLYTNGRINGEAYTKNCLLKIDMVSPKLKELDGWGVFFHKLKHFFSTLCSTIFCCSSSGRSAFFAPPVHLSTLAQTMKEKLEKEFVEPTRMQH